MNLLWRRNKLNNCIVGGKKQFMQQWLLNKILLSSLERLLHVNADKMESYDNF
jgi:hypothetical protein